MLLALESSCDETAAAICTAEGELLASAIASQVDIHRLYGGVVPEVASRNHILHVRPLVEQVLAEAGVKLADMRAFAATTGPDLSARCSSAPAWPRRWQRRRTSPS